MSKAPQLKIEVLADFVAPCLWQRRRAHLVPEWTFYFLGDECGYLGLNLRYDAPNGNSFYCFDYDPKEYVSIRGRKTDWALWAEKLSAAARSLEWEVGLFIMLCDLRVYGDLWRDKIVRSGQ